jgi:hypothetical protein
MSLNAIAIPAAREPGPLVTRRRGSSGVVEANGGVDVYVELGQAPPHHHHVAPTASRRPWPSWRDTRRREGSSAQRSRAMNLLQHLAGGAGSSGLLHELSQG